MIDNKIFIAEVKTKSPFGYESKHSFFELFDLACEYGDWISLHVDALWGGDYKTLSFAKRYTNKPILAKGLHPTDEDIKISLDHGADYILVVDRLPYPRPSSVKSEYYPWEKCLFEMYNENLINGNLSLYPQFFKQKFVVNKRKLFNRGTFEKSFIYQEKLNSFIDRGLWTCQASGIYSTEDIHPKVNAFIVGEHLIDFCNQEGVKKYSI